MIRLGYDLLNAAPKMGDMAGMMPSTPPIIQPESVQNFKIFYSSIMGLAEKIRHLIEVNEAASQIHSPMPMITQLTNDPKPRLPPSTTSLKRPGSPIASQRCAPIPISLEKSQKPLGRILKKATSLLAQSPGASPARYASHNAPPPPSTHEPQHHGAYTLHHQPSLSAAIDNMSLGSANDPPLRSTRTSSCCRRSDAATPESSGEFTTAKVDGRNIVSLILQACSTIEAGRDIHRVACHGFAPVQYKLGQAYEYTSPPTRPCGSGSDSGQPYNSATPRYTISDPGRSPHPSQQSKGSCGRRQPGKAEEKYYVM
ncbi:hypothetical protein M422DRAFT_782476 [Sphaerobolus stellatus SS14]|uniref:Uncharacterized protein n=1 Tax=Sphaerobolus stellatus (strain SS14) TaxID=990650 RepID=A0A0C9VDE7_SPHS4|nr:hypothetical protein M422DRAFT_782476 [Sphaerobolus stellatus SS14]